MGAYTNYDTRSKLISVSVNGTNDRPLIVDDGGIWLRITEIAR
jgi:VCBS repeat-containing protein